MRYKASDHGGYPQVINSCMFDHCIYVQVYGCTVLVILLVINSLSTGYTQVMYRLSTG